MNKMMIVQPGNSFLRTCWCSGQVFGIGHAIGWKEVMFTRVYLPSEWFDVLTVSWLSAIILMFACLLEVKKTPWPCLRCIATLWWWPSPLCHSKHHNWNQHAVFLHWWAASHCSHPNPNKGWVMGWDYQPSCWDQLCDWLERSYDYSTMTSYATTYQ